jgi:hypothetical protein
LIAEVHAYRGDYEQALKWAQRALEQTGSSRTREEMMYSPFLRSLHADVRWNTLIASASTD